MDEQQQLFKDEREVTSVGEFRFEPIKGQPMLHWRGKRPFESTQFYPAQLNETFGEETNGWMNQLYWGDNLQVMSHLLKHFRGKIDLIYIDPPFDSKADYKKKIELRGRQTTNDKTAFEEKQYTDIWSNDEYLQFMYERLILMRELLSDTGSIYLHCDWHKVQYLRVVMDEIFGISNCRNEVIWHYQTYQGQVKNFFPRKHDNLLIYSKGETPTFHLLKDSNAEQTIDYTRWRDYLNENNEITGANYPETDTRFTGYYNRFVKENHRKPGPQDVILKIEGNTIDSVWDIKAVDPKNKEERLDYPTQKPEALLERIIKASSNSGDLVFDCFMGSGTTQAVAMRLGRRFIGADINLGAIDTTVKRLSKIAKELSQTIPEDDNPRYTGFEVYNVNNYDVFRNPVQAKDLLVEALELQPLPGNELYDGEKDGRMFKIMPVNRIATRVDLNELVTGFPRERFEKRKAEAPNRPVESVMLVCMGHEPDLAAHLKLQMKEEGFNIDVQVIDILRDKLNLEFRRDPEAEVCVEGDKLVIRDYYPRNLLQKLSIEKTNVEEWRELVDSVKVDFNYDGSVFTPSVIDVPDDKQLVKGVYRIPAGAGTIKVKITDLLSESCEVVLQ